MLYLETKEGHAIVILEPANLQHLAKGGVVLTPDHGISFMYTPDAAWVAQEVTAQSRKPEGLDAAAIDRIHADSMRRVPVVERESPTVQMIHNGQPVASA